MGAGVPLGRGGVKAPRAQDQPKSSRVPAGTLQQVPCPTCKAGVGEFCVGVEVPGMRKRSHKTRARMAVRRLNDLRSEEV